VSEGLDIVILVARLRRRKSIQASLVREKRISEHATSRAKEALYIPETNRDGVSPSR
jgi:hypothetical protein